MNEYQQWRFAALSSLSFIVHLEQNLDLKELALVLEGWAFWASRKLIEAVPEAQPNPCVTQVMEEFTLLCRKEGGTLAEAQERVLEVWREMCT